MGTVYWITGFSGAGKSTIGNLFYQRLRETYLNTVFFDGDMLREVFGGELGYSEQERRKCAMRYARLCHMLQKQDVNVVCCTISMFDEVREWNRGNIPNYKEIYIKVSERTFRIRDQKGLYSGNTIGKQNEVAGIHIQVEEAKCPDMILYNDGEETPEEQADRIYECFCASMTVN